ncbi:S8 family serine peptidase, partial [Stenotrophomonas maltophilia]|uniref:S8 family peptidase n=1 Tax=Stenotrophomonas maltophilia TaxID=40324 RepID=UPI002097C6E0
MTRSLYARQSLHPLATHLAIAIAASLPLTVSAQSVASEPLDALMQQRSLQTAWARSTAPEAGIQPSAPLPPSHASDSSSMGAAGNPDSWKTGEFNSDWGLGAMNAQYAYARGLSAAGIRLGVFDSGTGLDHPEFGGKDHRSITIADLLADGSRCTNRTALTGPDACFSSAGDEVQVKRYKLDPKMPKRIADLLLSDPQLSEFLRNASYDDHGTHVGGTIAANRDGVGMHGVGFGADLTVAKLFFNNVTEIYLNGFGIGERVKSTGPENSALVDLYDQMNTEGVRAINHSWGLVTEPESAAELDNRYSDPEWLERLSIFADGAQAKGMIQVWAAGNTDEVIPTPEESPIAGIYATLPRALPDIEKYWLSVVNVDDKNRGNDEKKDEYEFVLSNRSNKCGLSANWCIAAPGTDINSTTYDPSAPPTADIRTDADGNVWLDVTQRVPRHGYGLKSGTSMAAPHITGALGLLFERFPYLDNAQVRDVLLTTARDLGDPGIDEIYGWGMVDLRKAIEGFGSLRVDTDVVMNQKAGGLKVWEGEAWDDWTNDIGGPGKLTKSGIGWLRLSGDNSFNGAVVNDGVLELNGANTLTSAVEVKGGQFLLNGSLVSTALNTTGGVSTVSAGGVLDHSNLVVDGGVISFNGTQTGGNTTVGANGLLKGVGTLGTTRVDGIIAPGNSIGTLTINGDYMQGATGVFASELAPGGRSDQLHVTGTATLDGTLVALPEPGVYYLGEQFNILRADGGINGQFART